MHKRGKSFTSASEVSANVFTESNIYLVKLHFRLKKDLNLWRKDFYHITFVGIYFDWNTLKN